MDNRGQGNYVLNVIIKLLGPRLAGQVRYYL